jgi:hypothetical protein
VTNTSLASQSISTSTSTQTHRSRKTFLNNPTTTSPSATSSASSIGYYKSNRSDASLNSPSALYTTHQHINPNLVSSQDPRHQPRQHPIRTSSCSSSNSNNFGYYHSGSESYDPATSGAETDALSDQLNHDEELYQSISSTPSFDPNRNTPTVSQRSRKQALYSRPSCASPSPGSSLAGSISTSTLNASEAGLETRIEGLCLTNTMTNNPGNVEQPVVSDERLTGRNPSRRRIRRKKPSSLLLNKVASSLSGGADNSTLRRSPVSALSHRASTIVSANPHECPQPGDLAFAADSEDEECRQNRSSIARRQAHPNGMLKNEDPPSSPTAHRIPLAANRGLSTRSRSNINRSQTSAQVTNENKQCLSPPDTTSDEGSGKIFKPKRPLSFTALFSRSNANAACPPAEHPVSNLFSFFPNVTPNDLQSTF